MKSKEERKAYKENKTTIPNKENEITNKLHSIYIGICGNNKFSNYG